VYASRTQDPETAIRFAKSALLIFLAASCVVSVVAPELTIERNYPSLLPGITIRFWGLESHANSMAPMALVYLLLAMATDEALRIKPQNLLTGLPVRDAEAVN